MNRNYYSTLLILVMAMLLLPQTVSAISGQWLPRR